AEVEQALASHPGVRESAAAAKTVGGDRRLVAYIVGREIGSPNANQARNHLLKFLPDYMIPSAFVFMDRLPLAGNGKVDRNLLPLPDPIRPNLETRYEEPRDALEVAVAEVWSDLLGLSPLGVHDHFLELGGDSLLAAQIASRIWDRFGLEMGQQSLFDRPTIAELAEYIRSNSGNTDPIHESSLGVIPLKEVRHAQAEHEAISGSYKVVVNLEEQYSLLPVAQRVPSGWRETAMYGTRQECLDQIAHIWTDLRPLTVRRHLPNAGDVFRPE
ncbi:MAG: hypothetical protein JWO19_4027, partial [Bryobacterales bacterium]|nr:hypothetical protein [Bryobacterales bacterium]